MNCSIGQETFQVICSEIGLMFLYNVVVYRYERCKMEIKMIAVDLDDTLLRDDKTISDRTKAALDKCRDKGIKLIFATGRGQSAQTFLPSGFFDGCVKMNGAVAYAGDLLVYEKLVSTAHARDLLLAADRTEVQIVVEKDGWHYANFDVISIWGLGWLTGYEISDFKTLDISADKIYALPKSDLEIELLKSHLPEGLYLITARTNNFTMILHKDANKARGIAALAAHWGFTIDNVVAFGDDTNDLEMLQYCGIGIAMGNAIDEVKSVADNVCDTNENDGIAKWLEEHVL